MNHIIIDLINISDDPLQSLCAVEAVFFEPLTGQIGKSFYSPIDLRVSTGQISVQTAFEWMKKDSHWRAELMSATKGEGDVLSDLRGFITNNIEPPLSPLFAWFKGAPVKLVSLHCAIERTNSPGIFPDRTKFRCICSLIDLAAVTGYVPHAQKEFTRFTMTDAVYQAEQVSEIWQRLTSHFTEME